MDLVELKLASLGIDREKYGRIFSFVDFGNVNYWFSRDRRDLDGNILAPHKKVVVKISRLAQFLDLFSIQKRFYYGWHQRFKASWHIIIWAQRNGFIKVTKPIQFVRHYLNANELSSLSPSTVSEDLQGKFIEIPKSNFDVEISVDAIRLMDKYDTICLLSGDSDFTRLAQFLRRQGKRVIIIASGHILHALKDAADWYINAQKIKPLIATVK